MDVKTRILLKFLIEQSKKEKSIKIGAYLSKKLCSKSRKTKKYVNKLIKLFLVSGANSTKDEFICNFCDETGLACLEKSLQDLRKQEFIKCYDDKKFCYEDDGTDSLTIPYEAHRYSNGISIYPWDKHVVPWAFAIGDTIPAKKDQKSYNWDWICEVTDAGKKYPVSYPQIIFNYVKNLYHEQPVTFILGFIIPPICYFIGRYSSFLYSYIINMF